MHELTLFVIVTQDFYQLVLCNSTAGFTDFLVELQDCDVQLAANNYNIIHNTAQT